MKKNLIFVLFLICVSHSYAQIKFGLYKIEEKLPEEGLISCFPKTDTILVNGYHRDVLQHIKNEYLPLIKSKLSAKYAVVSQSKDIIQDSVINIILLNSDKKDQKNVGYSDGIIRKYYEFPIKITKNSNYNQWIEARPFQSNFYNYHYDLPQNTSNYYNTSEYLNEKNKNVSYMYNYKSTICTQENFFILKNINFKLYKDSIIYPEKRVVSDFLGVEETPKEAFMTTQELATQFTLIKANHYIQIIPIQKNIKFSTHSNILALKAGDFIALTKETDEWYEGDYISENGEIMEGKIFIDDLISDSKSKIISVNNLNLRINYSIVKNEEFASYDGEIYNIKIYNSKDKLIQVIKNPGLLSRFGSKDSIVNIIDANFDGYLDIEIYAHDGGAGPNSGNNYYLFNPKNQQFEFHQQLSELTQIQVDGKSKNIYAAWRNGAANHGAERYKWLKGKLTQVEYYETNYLDEDKIIEIHEILINGKWKKSIKKLTSYPKNLPKSVTGR